jgi:hypothetical protein
MATSEDFIFGNTGGGACPYFVCRMLEIRVSHFEFCHKLSDMPKNIRSWLNLTMRLRRHFGFRRLTHPDTASKLASSAYSSYYGQQTSVSDQRPNEGMTFEE